MTFRFGQMLPYEPLILNMNVGCYQQPNSACRTAGKLAALALRYVEHDAYVADLRLRHGRKNGFWGSA